MALKLSLQWVNYLIFWSLKQYWFEHFLRFQTFVGMLLAVLKQLAIITMSDMKQKTSTINILKHVLIIFFLDIVVY